MFKALADPTRRSLQDELFREDGQTLGMLEERFAMTRFGVMKHLKLLEEAGLVVTRRRGHSSSPWFSQSGTCHQPNGSSAGDRQAMKASQRSARARRSRPG